MKVTALGDLHGYLPDFKNEGEILFLLGDYTARSLLSQWDDFFSWVKDAPYNFKVMIAGNHDHYLDYMEKAEKIRDHEERFGFTYLSDSGTTHKGFNIWGSPWVPYFEEINMMASAFTLEEEELTPIYEKIPDNIDILLTHAPPLGILDKIRAPTPHVGSAELYLAVEKVKPSYHFFGHIHECAVATEEKKWDKMGTTTFSNVSFVNEHYLPHYSHNLKAYDFEIPDQP